MVSDGVLYDLEELLRAVYASNGKFVQQLHHEPTKSLESAGNSDMWVHLYECTLCGVYVNLQQSRLVQRRVKERQEALMSDIRPGIGDIASRLCEDALMVVAIEQRVFCLGIAPVARFADLGDFVCFEARLLEHDEKPAGAVRSRWPTRDVCLHWDHRWIGAGDAARSTGG